MSLIPLFALSFLSHLVLLSSAEEKKQNHPSCPKIFCDELGEFGFPFNNKTRPECGLYSVDCSEKIPKIQFTKGVHCFHVERISQYDSILIMDISSPSCLNPRSCESIKSFSLPNASFSNISVRNPWTVFNCSCSLGITVPSDFHRTRCGGHGYDIYYTTFNASLPFAQQCSTIQLPPFSHRTPDNEILFLTNFTVEVLVAADCFTCHYEGGQCETNSKNKYCCSISTAQKGHKDLALKLGLGIGLSLFVIGVIVFLLWRYKQKRSASQFLSRNSSDPYNNLVQEGGSTYFGVHVFAYKDLEEATNNFDRKNKLGDGGFGTVYHGKLKDGREVAVKRLHEHNYKRVEQYINEIEILTRLRHTNLVSLWGCTSLHSKELLLVYEYITNGTVADHLHGYRAQTSPLTWPIRMSIAIETATALAYLHASDIIHRDVKTKNILLDNNFCVKVADFGLSRPFPNDVTHVSTAPQGTPGYVDPEYHQCYHLTRKSDVYSFGVVLVELISSMPAVDMNRLRHEINLSNLALSKIQKGTYNELVDSRLGFDLDSEVKRMTIAVAELAFQCLQQDKEMRPSMDEVLEELQRIGSGTHESENQVKGFDGVIVETQPSSDCYEVGLLKNKKEQPTSPNTVTENWHSSRSLTPNISH